MGAKLHHISNVDPLTRTADCSMCGRVGVKSRTGSKYWACKNAARLWQQQWKASSKERDPDKWTGAAIKSKCVAYMGGKCVFCGYDRCYRALHFHHVNPESKEFMLSRSIKRWEKLSGELRKCILVCSNCHAEIHDGMISQEMIDVLFHGSLTVELSAVNREGASSNLACGASFVTDVEADCGRG